MAKSSKRLDADALRHLQILLAGLSVESMRAKEMESVFAKRLQLMIERIKKTIDDCS